MRQETCIFVTIAASLQSVSKSHHQLASLRHATGNWSAFPSPEHVTKRTMPHECERNAMISNFLGDTDKTPCVSIVYPAKAIAETAGRQPLSLCGTLQRDQYRTAGHGTWREPVLWCRDDRDQ
jgi:hypothetical protein